VFGGLPGFDLRHPFAFHVSIGNQAEEMDGNSESLMATQDERIISRVLDTSLAVETLERYIEGTSTHKLALTSRRTT
jgi:hypothetical protein